MNSFLYKWKLDIDMAHYTSWQNSLHRRKLRSCIVVVIGVHHAARTTGGAWLLAQQTLLGPDDASGLDSVTQICLLLVKKNNKETGHITTYEVVLAIRQVEYVVYFVTGAQSVFSPLLPFIAKFEYETEKMWKKYNFWYGKYFHSSHNKIILLAS